MFKKRLYLISIVILVIVVFIGFTWKYLNKEEIKNLSVPTQNTYSSQTELPFKELTIEYLRNRSYESAIGELKLYQKQSNYSSYLTSYNSDGLKINSLLTIPNGDIPEGGWPAIVFVHGYIPPSIYQTTSRYTDYINYLARNGFVVFKIDLRGNGESEGSASGAYYSGGYVIDTLNAYSALQNADFVNPDKIGFWGHSMAGNVTFRSFVAKQNIKAIVIWAGAVYSYDDLQKYRLNDNSYRPPSNDTRRNQERQKLRETWGDYSPESDFWKSVVPTNFLEGVTGAIEIHHAVDDNIVNIGYSRDLMTILDKTTINHKLFEYQSGGHNITGTSFSTAMQSTLSIALSIKSRS